MKLLVVDDHAVVIEGVAALLRNAFPGSEVLQAKDAAAGIIAADDRPNLDGVLLDLVMPGGDGMSALESFGSRHPALPVIVFSSSESPSDVRRALALGALGYVPKSASPSTLVAALTLVLSGEIYVPPFVAQSSIKRSVPRPDSLTERQSEVLELLDAQLSNKQIAHQLGLSEKTVKAHVTAILRAMNVGSRGEAARAGRSPPAR